MVSIVIPAHNEQAVIVRCLRALPLDEAEVVVVCNGCTDDTASVAATVHPAVRVETVPDASKTRALNHGDSIARSYPRIYLDADAVLSADAVKALCVPLEAGGALATSPAVIHDLSQSSALVRSYYRIWSELPSVGGDIVGCGAYAVSAEGRQRFDVFPELLGDDHFVRDVFRPAERLIVDATSTVTAPRTVRDLVRRKVRVFTGNRLVYAAQPGGRTRGRKRQVEWLGVVRRDRRRVFDAPVYLVVTVVAKGISRWRHFRGDHLAWGRDESSRDFTHP